MCKANFVAFLLLAVSSGFSQEIVESEVAQLPKLFHLDDYNRCLAKKDGVFCVGQFQLYSDVEENPTYNLIQKYQDSPVLYNRSYVHHGYCLTTRCPGTDANLTARFEACVDKWAKWRHGLRARIHTLHYCQRPGLPPSSAPDTNDLPHRVFVYVIQFLLFMNAVGTIYDIATGDSKNKIPMLMIWSIRSNWRRLTAADTRTKDDTVAAFDGYKLILIIGAVWCHSGFITARMFLSEPRKGEKALTGPLGTMMGALTTVTQSYVVISNYLTTYNLIKVSKNHNIGYKAIPLLIIRRIIRMYPLYLLMNGFAATWWCTIGDGPMWPVAVGPESNVCRQKFWVTAGFLQNFIYSDKICLVQTWILAVDMQIHVLSLISAITLVKFRSNAKFILPALYLLALGTTAYVSFKNNYSPLFYTFTPEFGRDFGINRVFVEFFCTPVNCLMSAATGVILGYVIPALQEKKVPKIMSRLLAYTVPLMFIFCYHAYYFKITLTESWWPSAMIIVERLLFNIWISILIYSKKSPVNGFFRMKAMTLLGRLAMSVSMVHWCVNSALVTNRTSIQEMLTSYTILETIGTSVISFLIAVPLTVMVEYPLRKTLMKILNL